MTEPMQVRIVAVQYFDDPSYQGSVLYLPASQEAMRDVFQRAHIKEGEPYFMEADGNWPGFLRPILERRNLSLEEVNLLAYKMTQMSEQQKDQYEGILKLLPEKNMKQVINALYNLEQFEFLPGIVCDDDIGEMTIDNELDPLLKDLPGEIYPLLDTEKVGAYVREKEPGVFTSKGYCYRVSDQWQEVYDGKQIPEQMEEHRHMFSLHFAPEKESAGLNGDVWLKLPCNRSAQKQPLELLGEVAFEDCSILEVRSIVPLFEYSLSKELDVELLNQLAKELEALSEKELLKYKAIVEFECCSSVEQATELVHQLNQYELDTKQVTFSAYGRECLEVQGADLNSEAFRRFDFETYGKDQCIKTGKALTSYGLVFRDFPLEEEQIQEGGLQIRGME